MTILEMFPQQIAFEVAVTGALHFGLDTTIAGDALYQSGRKVAEIMVGKDEDTKTMVAIIDLRPDTLGELIEAWEF